MLVRDVVEDDLPAILAIHTDAVLKTSAIWDREPGDLADRREWLHARQALGYPVLACEDDGILLGYASFGDFRPRWGYRHSVEHSVYVGTAYRRRGAARMLLEVLIERARRLGKHVMVGGVEAGNDPSIALHTALGFEAMAALPQVGAKFGRWLDLVFMTFRLDDRTEPGD